MSTQRTIAISFIAGLILGGIVGFSIGQWGLGTTIKWLIFSVLAIFWLLFFFVGFINDTQWEGVGLIGVIIFTLLLWWWTSYYDVLGLISQSAMPPILGFAMGPPKKKFGVLNWLRKDNNTVWTVAVALLGMTILAGLGMKLPVAITTLVIGISSVIVGFTTSDEKNPASIITVGLGAMLILAGTLGIVAVFGGLL